MQSGKAQTFRALFRGNDAMAEVLTSDLREELAAAAEAPTDLSRSVTEPTSAGGRLGSVPASEASPADAEQLSDVKRLEKTVAQLV